MHFELLFFFLESLILGILIPNLIEEKENFKNSLQPRATNLRASLDYSRSQAARTHVSRKRKINDLSFHS